MSKPIDRIRAKVARAKQHIQDFQLALKAFSDTNPYQIDITEETQGSHPGVVTVTSPDGTVVREDEVPSIIHKVRIYNVRKVEDVPDKVAAIAADALKNLREPLDHLAYQLVLAARSGTPPDWRVYYPITTTAADYLATRGGRIKCVRQEVIDAIDATEPYQGGRGHVLWQLNALNNIDKHQLLVAAVSILSDIEMSAGIHPQLPRIGLRFTMKPTVPLIVGNELFRDSAPILPVTDHQVRFAFNVAFHHPGIIEGEPGLKTLQDMANVVDNIVIALGRFLP